MHSKAERVLKTIVAKHLKQFDITRMEWIVLATIDSNETAGGYTMSELSKILDIKLSQLTILIAGICANGFTKQVSSEEDRRTKYVTITPKGSRLIVKIDKTMRSAMREWLSEIPRQNLKNYMATLDLLGKINT